MEINDLVLIKDDNAPPTQWLKGRVIEVHPGADNLVRVATLKTVKGTVKRPIAKLCLLPKISNNNPTIDSGAKTSTGINIQEESTQKTQRNATNYKNLPISIDGKTQMPIINDSGAKKPIIIDTGAQIPVVKNMPRKKQTKKQPASNKSCGGYNLRSRTFLTLIVFIGLIAQVFGNKFQVTPFSNQPGIYFEELGDVHFTTGEWTILVHYDLKPYLQLRINHQKSIAQMTEICNKIDQTSCRDVIAQFKTRQMELNDADSLIFCKQRIQRRRKRSPFDFIGTIANEAFGVLDQRHAKRYAMDIEKLANNDQYMHKLLKEHMSVIRATNRVIHTNENRTQQHFTIIEESINTIERAYQQIQTNVTAQRNYQQFTNTAFKTILSMTRAETIQQNIINIIIDSSHGKLNPIIFPIEVAREQITLIKAHLSSELIIPGEEGIKDLYSSMKIRTTTYDAMVLFEIKIPLYNSKRFQLYRSLPVPTPINDSFMSIQPATEYLIINLQRDIYYPLNEIELLRCVKRQDNSFACQLKHPLYKPASGKNTCELNLLKHRGMTDCQIKKQPLTSLWTQLTSTNKWLYSTTHPITIDIICDDEVHSQQLMGSGQIQFFDQCKIERDDIMIQTTKLFTSSFNASFIPSFNLTEILNTTDANFRITKFNHNNVANFEELDNNIETLQNAMNDTPANMHDIHHYCANYTTSSCIIIMIGIYLYKRHRSILPRLQLSSSTPTTPTAEAAEC